jgi:hypothetical protein
VDRYRKKEKSEHLHQRHETYWVKTPPRMGPKAIPSWPIPMFKPRALACFLTGKTQEMIVKAPVPMPEAPAPAMARPMISMGDDTAAPAMADPSSKIRKKTR